MSRASHGFSFLEIMFAVALIGGVLAPILYFIQVSHRGTKVSVNEVTATNLASEIIEAVQALPVDVLTPIDESEKETFTGDLIQNGSIQPDFYDKAFGDAEKQGFRVAIPPFPKNWNCNLIIEPIMIPSDLLDDDSEGKRTLAETVKRLIMITIRISWKEYGTQHSLKLKTVRGQL
jgi:type II secretory pathway pseudopilin PulG